MHKYLEYGSHIQDWAFFWEHVQRVLHPRVVQYASWHGRKEFLLLLNSLRRKQCEQTYIVTDSIARILKLILKPELFGKRFYTEVLQCVVTYRFQDEISFSKAIIVCPFDRKRTKSMPNVSFSLYSNRMYLFEMFSYNINKR